MNREQKIALIIGFAVILVVGVLVSDHLSRARQLELADADEGDATRYERLPVVALNDRTPAAVPVEVEVETERRSPREDPAPAFVHEPTNDDVLQIAQGSRTRSDSPLGDVLDFGEGQSKPEAGRISVPPGGFPAAAAMSRRDDGPIGKHDEPAPRADALPVQKPEPIRHRVRPNESLYVIAKKYYGNGSLWSVIADANPKLVDDNGNVRVDRVLVIPVRDGMEVASASREIRVEERPNAETTSYTVRKNDTLGEIAQKTLGTSKRMQEIVTANSGKIDDPDDIRVGMVLKIPAR